MMRNAIRRLGRVAWPVVREVRAIVAPLLGDVRGVHACAMTVPGWISGDEARAMVRASLALGDDPVIVEIGIFMGRSTALLAGARRRRGSGRVYCIDPFDCSGDDYSTPVYQDEMNASGQSSLEQAFRRNMTRCGLDRWIEVRKGTSAEVARDWTLPIDLLLLDADYSAAGARAIFEEWVPFLKPGGTLILPNSKDRHHAEGHDGNRRLVAETVKPPAFAPVRTINELTVAERAA